MVLELSVKTKSDLSAAFVPLEPLGTPTQDYAQQTKPSVQGIMIVDQMRSVWSQDNVFVHHPSSLTLQMEGNVRVRVRDTCAESMLTVLQLTLQDASVKQGTLETLFRVV